MNYATSHQNKTNQRIHKVCVPLILWACVALIYSIPVPNILNPVQFNWSNLSIILILLFYLRLGIKPFVLMLLQFIIILLSLKLFHQHNQPTLIIAVIVFILAWIGQFIGHKVEGKKPSFFKDLQFLLIGPIWVFIS